MTMTWDAFLNHPPIVTYHQSNPGQYLFLKTLHEIVVGCFAYQQWGRLLNFVSTLTTATEIDKQAVQHLMTSPVHRWYDTWLPHISRWRADLLVLRSQYSGQIEAERVNWPLQINMLADVITDITRIHREAFAFGLLENERVQQFLDGLRESINRISLIHDAIRSQDYITIYDYPHNDKV